MKKHLMILLSVILFASCSGDKTPEQLRDEILNYKEKISLLEKKLKEIDTVSKKEVKIKVNVKKAVLETVSHTFSITGNVTAEKSVFVTPEMNGQIKKIYVSEGQKVRKGQILVMLNGNVTRNGISEVKTALQLAQTIYEKQKKLWEQKVGKEIDYLQAENGKKSLEAKLKTLNSQLDMTIIKAPISGIIDEIYLKEGELASPGRQLIDLVSLEKLEIEADISEEYLPYLKKDAPVMVSFPAFPDIHIKTKISRTGNIVNKVNRTFKLKVKLNNIENKIKPNMIADLLLSDYTGNNILLPSMIVKTDVKGEYVYIVKNNRAVKIYVETGISIGQNTVINKGINEGDFVVIEGANLLANGSGVAINKEQ